MKEGRATGFDVEPLQAVAEATGLKLDVQPGDWRDQCVAAQSGSVALDQLASWIPDARAHPVIDAAFAFMVHGDNQELVERLNRGVALVKQRGAYDELDSRWFRVYDDKPLLERAPRVALVVLVSVSVLLLLSLAWTRSLRRTVQIKTGELERELDEHRSTLDALRRSEARFETLFRASPMVTAIVALPGGEVIDVNDSVKPALGFEREELIGRSANELGLYVDPNLHDETTAELREKTLVVKEEVKVRTREGEERSFFASNAALELEGRPAALVVAADITEAERSRRCLIDARRIEAVGKLAGAVAHDFNNILTSIQGHAEICRNELIERGEDPQALESILEASGREDGESRGLDLAMAEGIVHQSGGFISVRNRAGGGRVFALYLPETTEAARDVTAGAGVASRAGVQRVLLVEDESPVCALISRILRTLGYEVSSRERAEDALEAIESGEMEIDLLITDVLMPGIDGRELAERTRRIIPDLPILFISGYAEREVFHRIGAMPGTSFLRKPFGTKDLKDAVSAALRPGA